MRWYTRALRIPRLIGKMPSGERIKGGPYRQGQLVAAGAVFILAVKTMRWWGAWGFFGNWGAVLVLTLAAGAAAKHIPSHTVSPLLLAGGAARAVTAAKEPVWAGRSAAPPRTRRPVPARVTLTGSLPDPDPEVAPGVSPPAAAPPTPALAEHPSPAAARLAALLTAREGTL